MASIQNDNALTSMKPRNTSSRLNLTQTQFDCKGISGVRPDLIFLASNTIPAWGSQFNIDIKNYNNLLHNVTLCFNLPAITGRSGDATSFPNYVPANFFVTKVEIKQNNQTADTLLPAVQHIITQTQMDDEDRCLINSLQGAYNSAAQRNTMSTVAGQNYYIPLRSFFDVVNPPLLSDAHMVTLVVSMANLADVVCLSGGSGTAVSVINSCTAILKVSKIEPILGQLRLQGMIKSPEHSFFHTTKTTSMSIATGSTTATLTLNTTGKIAHMWFTVRPITGLTQAGLYTYLPISSMSMTDSSQFNITSGGTLSSQVLLGLLGSNYNRSSYTSEIAGSANVFGNINNYGSYAYGYSFSTNISKALSLGLCLGSKQFTGQETLTVNFPSALTSASQLDVYFLVESCLEQSGGYVKSCAI